MQTRRHLPRLLPFLLLLAGAFLLYAQSFGHQWTMDDSLVVARNTDIRSLKGFFENSYPGRPLREITYLLDYQLFGDQPAGYHLQNIFWHGLNTCLLVILARTLGLAQPLAWLAGLLFLVHPLNVEVVANISHRKDSLAMAFSLLALLAFLKVYKEDRRWLWMGISAAALVMAGLAKQTAVAVIPVMLGYDLWVASPEQKLIFRRPWVFWMIGAFGLAGLIGVFAVGWWSISFRSAMESVLVHMNVYSDLSPGTYLLVALKAVAFMALRLVWPVNLAMEYVFPPPEGWVDPWVLAGVVILMVLGGLVWKLRHQSAALVGVLLMIGFWLPVSNLLWPFSYFAADRYMYAVCAGFALLVAWGAGPLLARFRPFFFACSAVLLAMLALLTWRQDKVWANELTLYTQALAVSPESTSAMMGVGLAHLNAGDPGKAREFLEKAAMNFNDSKALYLLGLACERQGDRQGAIGYYRRFVMMNEPRYHREVASARRQLMRLSGAGQ